MIVLLTTLWLFKRQRMQRLLRSPTAIERYIIITWCKPRRWPIWQMEGDTTWFYFEKRVRINFLLTQLHFMLNYVPLFERKKKHTMILGYNNCNQVYRFLSIINLFILGPQPANCISNRSCGILLFHYVVITVVIWALSFIHSCIYSIIVVLWTYVMDGLLGESFFMF